MNYHRTIDGDRIDLIVLKHYKNLDYLNNVIEANEELFKKDMKLKSGMRILLPDFKTIEKKEQIVALNNIKIFETKNKVSDSENTSDQTVNIIEKESDEDNVIVKNLEESDDNSIYYNEREPLW